MLACLCALVCLPVRAHSLTCRKNVLLDVLMHDYAEG